MDDMIERLERLARLRDSGALTQAEYDAEKATILSNPMDVAEPAGVTSTAPVPELAGERMAAKPRGRRLIIASAVIVVLILAGAAFAMWQLEYRTGAPFAEAGSNRLAPAAPPARLPSTPPASSVSNAPAAAAQADNDDSDADEAADDNAYYAAAAPFMRIPVRVAWDGHDYCCLTMGMIYERLQPNQLEFKREDADHVDLTSTDLSVHPWRMITYVFVKHAGDWRLEQVIDIGGPNTDAHSAVSPDQAMVEQFKLTQQPGTTTTSSVDQPVPPNPQP